MIQPKYFCMVQLIFPSTIKSMEFWICFGNYESSAITFNLILLGILHRGGGSTQSLFQQQLIVCLMMIV